MEDGDDLDARNCLEKPVLVLTADIDDSFRPGSQSRPARVGRVVGPNDRRQVSIEMCHLGADKGKRRREGYHEERPYDDEGGGEAEAKRRPHALKTT